MDEWTSKEKWYNKVLNMSKECKQARNTVIAVSIILIVIIITVSNI